MPRRYSHPAALVILALCATPLAAQAPKAEQHQSPPRHVVRRTRGEIKIDGVLKDRGWQGIRPLSPLVASSGAKQSVPKTIVRTAWDDTHLYLAFECEDKDVWAKLTKRDEPLYREEVVEFFLSTTGDPARYDEFEISPANVIFDGHVRNPEGRGRTAGIQVDTAWDAKGLRSAVRVEGTLNDPASADRGWTAEVAVPFKDLGLAKAPVPGTVWRGNFYRIERGAEPLHLAWSPTHATPADFHVPARFGELEFSAAR